MKLFKYFWTFLGLIIAIIGTYISLYGHDPIKKAFSGNMAIQLIRLGVYGVLIIIPIALFYTIKILIFYYKEQKGERLYKLRKEKIIPLFESKALENNSILSMLFDIYINIYGDHGFIMLKHAKILFNDKAKLLKELKNPALRKELDRINSPFKLSEDSKSNDTRYTNKHIVIHPLLLAMISDGVLTYENGEVHIDSKFKHDFDELIQLIEEDD